MVERKERPRCRKEVGAILEKKGWSLQELAADMKANRHRYSDALRTQAHKMLEEKG